MPGAYLLRHPRSPGRALAPQQLRSHGHICSARSDLGNISTPLFVPPLSALLPSYLPHTGCLTSGPLPQLTVPTRPAAAFRTPVRPTSPRTPSRSASPHGPAESPLAPTAGSRSRRSAGPPPRPRRRAARRMRGRQPAKRRAPRVQMVRRPQTSGRSRASLRALQSVIIHRAVEQASGPTAAESTAGRRAPTGCMHAPHLRQVRSRKRSCA